MSLTQLKWVQDTLLFVTPFSPNHRSVLADPDFVNEAVSSLLYRGMFQKCKEVWEPVQELTWLWTDINSLNCSITILATRTERLKQSVNELLSKQGRHAVASVFNQIISMSIVIGTVCQIMTCFLSIDILKVRTWNSYIKYRSVIFLEL